MNSIALPTVAERSSVRTCGGSRPRDSSQTMPRSGSVKLWNSSMTTAATSLKSKAFAVEEAVQEDFGDDDQHPGGRIFAAVAGHQADVGRIESPAGGRGLHLAEFLFRQGDQRRGVIGGLARVQGLEQRRLGDERLARARRRETSTPCSAENQASRASSWIG